MAVPKGGPSGLLSLQRGTYSSKGEKIDWTYYDTVSLLNALGATTFRMFTQAIGQTDPSAVVKTLAITNMKTSGIMPQNQRFIVRAIKIAYYAHAPIVSMQTIYDVINTAVLSVSINGKDATYQKVLGEVFNLAMAVENATGAVNIVNQMANNRFVGVDVLNKPIVLAANVPFEVDLQLIAASAAGLDTDRIRVMLSGMLLRAM